MRKIGSLLLFSLLSVVAFSQVNFTPQPVGAYINPTGTGAGWMPLVGGGAGQAASFTPPPMGLYTYNGTAWVPWIGTGSGGGQPISGATADYYFTDGSGTKVKDFSGNGNTGTFGANAPTWVTNGLSFTSSPTQSVALPTALNTTATYEMAVYITPLSQTAISSNAFPVLMNSSEGGGSLNLGYWSNFNSGGWSPAIFAQSGFKTITTNGYLMSGFHVITIEPASSGGDRMFVDGVETDYGASHGNSFSFHPTTGHMNIGSDGTSPYTASGFIGTFYRLRTFSTALTAAQVAQDAYAITAEIASRGVAVTPTPTAKIDTPQLLVIGDSISCAYNGTVPCTGSFSWFSQLSLTANFPATTNVNLALFNAYMRDIEGSAPNKEALYCSTTQGPSIAIVFAGTNDQGSQTSANTFLYLASEVQTLKKAGCRVLVGTMISRNSFDAKKNTYNILIRSQLKAIGADGIIDFAANPNMGADNAYSNSTYFQADGTHPTATGQAQLATVASNSLNYYFGSAASNIVTTNTYQMLSSDRFITAAPTASAAWTMPSCQGPSGESYTIQNPQSAQTLTIVGGASQPINGLSSAITIASNSTVILTSTPNVGSTSGCNWTLK